MFSIGLVTADSYMTKPLSTFDASYSEFRASEVSQVPVIRVFGSLPTGEKACLHIHGVFPYLYVPCLGGEPPERLGYRVASALDKALNVSLGCSTATTQHVYSVATVSAIPFYGYHSKEQQFLKVSLYNPAMVKRAADLLQSGAVLGRSLQPHNAHLPFVLQFMIDYNLHGMSPVLVERALFRRPALSEEDLLMPESVQRVSSCAVEADVVASAILNPRALHGGVDGNPGLAGIWEEERERRRAEGRGSQPTPHTSQPRHAHLTSDELHQRILLKERLAALKSQEAGSQVHYQLDDQGVASMPVESVLDNEYSSASQSTVAEEQVVQDLLCLRECNEATDTDPEAEQDQEGEEEEEEKDEEDLSLPLESPNSVQCNIKADAEEGYSDVIWEDSYWEQFSGRIPQLDGAEDDEDTSTYSPVICSGKFGRQCASNRGRDVRQLSSETVMDGTRWPEYRGLLDGLSSDLGVNPLQIASTEENALRDCVEFPYDLGLDLDALEVGPICAAPTPGYESVPVDMSSGANLTNYNLADMSEDYSSALINDVFLSAITDDATQCTDIQSLAGADFSSDADFQTPQNESVLIGEDMLVEETRRVPIPSKTVPSMISVSKNTPGVLHSCEDGSIFVGACSSSECVSGSMKGFPTKQFDIGPPINNFVMMTNSDGSINILNAAMASTAQFPKMCRDNTYVRLVPLSEYRSCLALGGEGESIKTSCIGRGEAGLFTSGMFGEDPFIGGRRVVSVDRTTETSPSLLRCSNSSLSGRDTDCNYIVGDNSVGFGKSKSTSKDKSKKVVKFFLKSSLLREKSRDSFVDVFSTSHDSEMQQLKNPGSHSNAYQPSLRAKSHSVKSSKLFRYNEKIPPSKINNFCEPFTKKSKVLCEKLVSSGKEMEGFSRMGVFNSNNRFYDRYTRDVTRPRSSAYHVSSAEDFFLPRKESVYPKSGAVERFEGRRAVEVQLSPTTSEEDKTLVKVESSPARSRGSPDDHTQFTFYRSGVDRKQGQECRSSERRDYDPYEFSDEMEELLSCSSPLSWSRRNTPGIGRLQQPSLARGGKPASYMQHGAAHRVTFHMTNTACTLPVGHTDNESEAADETASSAKGSDYPETSDVNTVVEQIKSEPVWDEEVTSIPKLTLLREGDSYINFVRLDEDNVPCSELKQEQPSEEDRPIEVAAVKDENEPDTCESSCSLEQSTVDDKTTVTTRPDMYFQEMRIFKRFSNDECTETKDVVSGMKDTQLEAALSQQESSNACVVAGTGCCEPYRSVTDDVHEAELLVSDQMPATYNRVVEVVDLSPCSNDASVEVLEVTCSTGDSKCKGRDTLSESGRSEILTVELEAPMILDDVLDNVEAAVSVVNVPLTMPVSTSTTPAAGHCILPDEKVGSLTCRKEETGICETKELQTQLISSPGVVVNSKEPGDMDDQDVLLQGTKSRGPKVVSVSPIVNPQCKSENILKVPKQDAIKTKKVKRTGKISEPRALKRKKPSFVVKKRSQTVKLKGRGGVSLHVKKCCQPLDRNGSEGKLSCQGSGYVGGVEILHRLRMRARGACIGKDLGKNINGGAIAPCAAAVHSAVSAPSHTNNEQVCIHSQDETVSKLTNKDKTVLNSPTGLVTTCKKLMQNADDDSSTCVSSIHKSFEHGDDILEQEKNSLAICSQQKSNSEWSNSVPVTPANSMQVDINSKVCNSDLFLGSIGDAAVCSSFSKSLRSGKQKNEKLPNAAKGSLTELSGSNDSPVKKFSKTLVAAARRNQVELKIGDSLHAAPVVIPGVDSDTTRFSLHVDNREVPLISRTPSKHSRAEGKAVVEQSPARASAKGRKKVVNVPNVDHNRRHTLPSVLESQQKLQHTEVTRDKTVNFGYKILSVSLSKALPKCKKECKASEQVFTELKDGYQSEQGKLSEVNCTPKIVREFDSPSKHGSCHYSQLNSCNSKPSVLPQARSKKLSVKKLRSKNDSGLIECKKVNNPCTELKKLKESNKDDNTVTNESNQEVDNCSKVKVKKRKLNRKSNIVGILNKKSQFETSKDNVLPKKNCGKTRKRRLIDASSSLCTERKLRKRCNEILCQSDENSSSTMESKAESNQIPFTVDVSLAQQTNVKILKKKGANKTVHEDKGSNFNEHKNLLPETYVKKSSAAVSTQTSEIIDRLTTQRNSEQKQNSLKSVEKSKVHTKFLQHGKRKVSKIIRENVGMKGTSEILLCKTLRSGKKVSNHESLCENIVGNSVDKVILQQTGSEKFFSQPSMKTAGAAGTNVSAPNLPDRKKNKVGRPRKNILKGKTVDKHQEVKGSQEIFTEKPKFSKILKRNSTYVKQLRSYKSKQENEVGLPRRGRPRNFQTLSAPARKVNRNKKIPCLDGASGSSSSEEESLINCSQPSSPEPPLKRLKEGLVGIIGRRAVRSNTGMEKSSRCRPLKGKTKRGTPEKGKLAVEIVKSPRRQRVERIEGAEICGCSPVMIQGTLPVGAGLCLPAVEATSSVGGSSDNCTLQDAELVMEDGTVGWSLVPSKTLCEIKPKIVQFNDKNFICSSACDNVQEATGETVGAINHRSVRKKLDYPVGHQRQQQNLGGKQPIKILRRSSLDLFADSSSLSGDTCKCKIETVSVYGTSKICKSQSIEEVSSAVQNEQSVHKTVDSEEDEGIISFYETTLLSPAESACSDDSLGSLGQLPLSPQLQCPSKPRYWHQEPFYSDPRDVTGPMQVGSVVLHLRSAPVTLQNTDRNVVSPEIGNGCERKRILVPGSPGHDGSDEELFLSPVSPGPAHSTPLGCADDRELKKNDVLESPLQSLQVSALRRQVLRSQLGHELADSPRPASLCQVSGATPDNTNAFLLSFQNLQEARPITQHTFLTLLSMELHVSTRGKLQPDPHFDPIRAVFFAVSHDVPGQPRYHTGVLVVGTLLQGTGVDCLVESVADEVALLAAVEQLVAKWDPDILAGYEVEMLSWGYLFQRSLVLGVNLCSRVSRIPDSVKDSHVASSQEGKVRGDTHVAGRILLDVWRLMRHQVALQSYTFESVAYHVLHQRRPLHSHSCLTAWWDHPTCLYRWIVVVHYLERTRGTVRLLEQLDLLATTSELARLFGIQFQEVLTRGSQFRVESMMLRLAGLHNYVAVSPSVKQRAGMRAPEHLQLIMEPESRFYSDPVIVLDFQSLYPSIIIAYNYCYSTCLGRAQLLGQPGPFKFGCSELSVPLDLLEDLLQDISISPCGVAFVGAATRLGILPRMLQEILHTRLMVKQAMKDHPDDKLLQRVLHARQLGLKLIANVTYGYTAANFSGRMPCVEVGDSVVSKGRETLERAIQLVENTTRWQARVVYGDTDSMFVLVAGRSRAQAFAIGAEIAEAVTLDNPAPIKLKLEKVYQPCILQTKKRYVGYAYENPSQEQPTYDAKGIETVRRDGCPAVAKVLEKALRILFETRDVSLVKRYVCRQWDKLMQGRANVHDLVFAREYRGRAGYRPGACVPALQLARRWLQVDPRAEPRVGERVPYVIVNGPPAVPLIQLVRSPHDLLADPSLRVNARYYITRVIMPALRRCFSLLGADVDAWYASMPRRAAPSLPLTGPRPAKCSTISQYFATVNCAVCDQPTHGGLCPACLQQPQKVAAVLGDKLRLWERAHHNITQVCRSCCGRYEPLDCNSLDCPVLFRRNQAHRDLLQGTFVRELLARHLSSCDW